MIEEAPGFAREPFFVEIRRARLYPRLVRVPVVPPACGGSKRACRHFLHGNGGLRYPPSKISMPLAAAPGCSSSRVSDSPLHWNAS